MTMPQMGSAFAGWTSKITLLKHTEAVINGFVKKNEIPISFNGTIQPLNARALSLKPEGQRSFAWLQIHCLSISSTLIPGDRFTYQGSVYKVMAQNDYSLNGFIEYHAVRDFQNGGTP